MFKTRRFKDSHIEASLELLLESYLEEKEHHSLFLSFEQTTDVLKAKLTILSKHSNYGYALYHDDEFIGFIIGHVIPCLWGKYDGFYAPLHGHAVKQTYRKKGYQFLYQFLSEELVSNNILSHAITLYVNDDVSMNTWFHLGFGLRLVDSFKEIHQTTNPTLPKDFTIAPVKEDNIKDVLSLQKKLHFYFEKAPLFMPQSEEDEKQELLDFINQQDHFIYGLYQKNQPIALMKLKPAGENYLTLDNNSIHICGLYVDEFARSKGFARILLNYVEYQCFVRGYTVIGVDFESFNLKGANFWHRHFTPYTYTVTRRIDENILKRTP